MQVIMIAVEVCVDRLKFSSSVLILLVSRVDRTKYKILTDMFKSNLQAVQVNWVIVKSTKWLSSPFLLYFISCSGKPLNVSQIAYDSGLKFSG